MSCDREYLDLKPEWLTIEKVVGDTLAFSVKVTSDGVAVNLSTASSIDYYLDGSVLAGLTTGVTVSGALSNIVSISKNINSEEAGSYNHKLVIVIGGVTRTYFDGKLIIK